ncbi:CHAT domain-containing protein [Streptomyces sp. NPDC053542]|uniref:CHAT domain-containing protein n=1 Tax=Streptomyces sp. NPDC053542 TaxID=3365710 RepID=UPI0037D08DB2
MITSTLTILDDSEGEYEDDFFHRRDQNQHVRGPLGGGWLLHDTVKALNRLVGGCEHCRRSELTLLGRCLYAIAFGVDGQGPQGGVPVLRQAFEDTYAQYKKNPKMMTTPFRLRLDIRREARELGRYPWEFLFKPDPEGGGFFLAGEQTELVLSRYVHNEDVALPEADSGPLRILVVLSRPNSPGLAQVRADTLIRAVEELRSVGTTVDVLDSPTRDQLRNDLLQHPTHILHFIGHGRGGAHGRGSGLALKKDERELRTARALAEARRARGEDLAEQVDEADWADSVSICNLLRAGLDGPPGPSGASPRGRLIFLHACEGDSPDVTEDSLRGFSSIARDLAHRERVAAVVAMQYVISIDDAERFAVHFYSWLRAGYLLDEAVSRARCELGTTPGFGRESWDHRCFGTPVIYVREASAFRRYADMWRQAGNESQGTAGQSESGGKKYCPNTSCKDGFIIPGQTRCRACNSQVMDCPRSGCQGLVMTAPGSECTVCDFKVASREEPMVSDGHEQDAVSMRRRARTGPRPNTRVRS